MGLWNNRMGNRLKNTPVKDLLYRSIYGKIQVTCPVLHQMINQNSSVILIGILN